MRREPLYHWISAAKGLFWQWLISAAAQEQLCTAKTPRTTARTMDIIFTPDSRDPWLALKKIERFDDCSGYSCFISVRSGWLFAIYRFIFEEQALVSFIDELEQLNMSLIGSATLKPIYEQQFLELKGDGRGHVAVRGNLLEHGAREQRVVFCFTIDQTRLKPLMSDLKVLMGPSEKWPTTPLSTSEPFAFTDN